MSTLSSAIAASASGLNAERARIEVAVSNLANAESTRSASGEPYRRRDVVLAADAVDPPFAGALQTATTTGVRVAAVVEDQAEFKRRYEPSHPDADVEGFVADEIHRFSEAEGGLLTGDDLASWQATLEEPATYDYRGLTVCKTGAWAAGPVGHDNKCALTARHAAIVSTIENAQPSSSAWLSPARFSGCPGCIVEMACL